MNTMQIFILFLRVIIPVAGGTVDNIVSDFFGC